MSGTAVFITPEPVGARMAGPAIRMYELARSVHALVPARLVSLTSADPIGGELPVVAARTGEDVRAAVEDASSLVIQGDVLGLHPWLSDLDVPVVVDVYDPFHLEQLHGQDGRDESRRRVIVRDCVRALNTQLARADLVLCASGRQRSLWLGHLAALGRVNPATYDDDPRLSGLVAVVPFGTTTGVRRSGDEVRAELGLSSDCRVAIWGGGVYPWFDLDLLLRAMAALATELPDARLVVLGGAHPVQGERVGDARGRARETAAELDLLGRTVLFPDQWIAYEDRFAWLAAADVGVSIHLDHLETEFSFRTRCLDYLAAGLPIITSGGDAIADIVAERSCGVVVPPGDLAALIDALRTAFTDQDWRDSTAASARVVAEEFRWERVAAPLVEFARAPRRAPDLAADTAQRALLGVDAPAGPGLRARVVGALAEGGPRLLAGRALARLRRLVRATAGR